LVYVVQEVPNKNIVPAQRFGELKILLGPGQVTFSPGPTVRALRRALREFTDKDYLLLIGDPVAIGLATSLAAEANQGRVQFLKWDKQERDYIPIKADCYLDRRIRNGNN
jgi:hypothetical protein